MSEKENNAQFVSDWEPTGLPITDTAAEILWVG